MMNEPVTNIRTVMLALAGVFAISAVLCSSWLICQHQIHMTNRYVQAKITGILWMVPIYSINSIISLVFPNLALYLDILRDCYEAYVLNLFLALMLAYLGCDENEYELISYLEAKLDSSSGQKVGKKFLQKCKFGTLQYCLIRPLTAVLAIILDRCHLYDEFDLGWYNGYIYILITINISVMYAFISLAAFYTELKTKLAPFKPIGKFLCIKFVIFFAFWQSVLIYGMVQVGWIRSVGGYSSQSLSTQLQDFLICIEMFILSIAHLYSFSYFPFVKGRRSHYHHDPITSHHLRMRLLGENFSGSSQQEENVQNNVLMTGNSCNDFEINMDSTTTTTAVESVTADKMGSSSFSSKRMHKLLSSHFAADSAIRDFNDSMPIIHIPTNFEVRKGAVILSNPANRIKEMKQQQPAVKAFV